MVAALRELQEETGIVSARIVASVRLLTAWMAQLAGRRARCIELTAARSAPCDPASVDRSLASLRLPHQGKKQATAPGVGQAG